LSARAASAVHKERTGKAFKISEEIVANEEMYEEEEEEYPHRTLAAAARAGGTSEMSARFGRGADLDELLRREEIDREFKERFGPILASQRSTAAMYGSAQNQFYALPTQSFGTNHGYQQQHPAYAMERDGAHSAARIPSYPLIPVVYPPQSRQAWFDEYVSTPALSPGSTQTQTPLSSATPQGQSEEGIKIEPFVDLSPAAWLADLPLSSLTPELPNNVKGIAGTDMADSFPDTLTSMLMGHDHEFFESNFSTEQPGSGNLDINVVTVDWRAWIDDSDGGDQSPGDLG